MKSAQPNKSPRERREALLEKKRASSCTVDSVVGFSPVFWEHEDELPEMSDDNFGAIFGASRLSEGSCGVRVYPETHGSASHADRPTAEMLCTVCKNRKRWPIDFVHTSCAVCKDCWDNWIADKGPPNATAHRTPVKRENDA